MSNINSTNDLAKDVESMKDQANDMNSINYILDNKIKEKLTKKDIGKNFQNKNKNNFIEWINCYTIIKMIVDIV